jgi:3-hydroxybutyryl-CoA dehydrogenase
MSIAEGIERVTVVGGGVMGNGIAQVVAQAGLEVDLVDLDEDVLTAARERIERSVRRLAEKGRMQTDEVEPTLARLNTTTDLLDAGERTDHVIESVVERFDVKVEVLQKLDAVCADDVVFASNTSQFSISRLAAATERPDRVIGSHWFNPPPLMDLIEIIRGVETSDATVDLTLGLADRYGKQKIVCKKDTPGFITSRLIVALALEAMRIADEGIADVADINKACVLAFNHAMGPLDTIDFSGLDTTLNVASSMTESYGERFLPPQNIRRLVAGGHFGRKTGRGFSEYE